MLKINENWVYAPLLYAYEKPSNFLGLQMHWISHARKPLFQKSNNVKVIAILTTYVGDMNFLKKNPHQKILYFFSHPNMKLWILFLKKFMSNY
jgi:hypothetical protein